MGSFLTECYFYFCSVYAVCKAASKRTPPGSVHENTLGLASGCLEGELLATPADSRKLAKTSFFSTIFGVHYGGAGVLAVTFARRFVVSN
jgi:hypothetical protein